ncbi:MAG: hypothetical protein U0X20_31175 [Caldilineaceae bacterium]
MVDLGQELLKFYVEHVNLSDADRKKLLEYESTNIKRLEKGLQALGHPLPQRVVRQGSIAMGTINQHADNEYDLDLAAIFECSDLPVTALAARQRVCDAMCQDGTDFAKSPEPRTNAVTVWYKAGHHVDIAVHRFSANVLADGTLEHAGAEWTPRDPEKVATWFNDLVTAASPHQDSGATVEPGQLRRIVQLLKMFARLYSDDLPGGIIITALAAECYKRDLYRDDMALANTMRSMYSRLCGSVEVMLPVPGCSSLTGKDKYRYQVVRFRDALNSALAVLAATDRMDCTQGDALQAWCSVYSNHTYWQNLFAEWQTASARAAAIQGAYAAGTLHTSTQGTLITSPSQGTGLPVLPHRFYGDK